jgi:bifunctional polynucleotide phosphatase/kinase
MHHFHPLVTVAKHGLEQAVASFFTPVSKKAPERMTWRIVNQSLLVGKYTPTAAPSIEASLAVNRRKVAAFDFVRSIALCIGVSHVRPRTQR